MENDLALRHWFQTSWWEKAQKTFPELGMKSLCGDIVAELKMHGGGKSQRAAWEGEDIGMSLPLEWAGSILAEMEMGKRAVRTFLFMD